ncbi:MAG: undecaprenyl-diphosphate phosphatase [Spirochaetales bacterium]|nr:undecaprenyl-diphosphate phosphatase [Spirochaetales bacterium]
MNEIQSVLLGIIQGLTEFLPVSSSGHLVFGELILGIQKTNSTFFIVLLHVATLCAVMIVFRKRLFDITGSLFRFVMRRSRPEDKENLRLFLILILATAATVVIALGLYQVVKYVTGEPKIISFLFIFTGMILLSTIFFKGKTEYKNLTVWHGLITGIAQGFGVFPGISRSGITISAALASGMKREQAGEYSFLLAIPAILGALVFEIKDAGQLAADIPLHVLALGFLAAFVIGILSLSVLLKIIKRGRLFIFSIYLIPLGIITFFLS